MIRKIRKIFIFITIFFIFSSNYILAAQVDIGEQSQHFAESAGFDTAVEVENIVSLVINSFLSLLAIIFIILIIYAGWNWMTAQGEEQKVTRAKDTIYRAIIGLVITLGAFAITYFVFSHLPFAGGNSSAGITGGSSPR